MSERGTVCVTVASDRSGRALHALLLKSFQPRTVEGSVCQLWSRLEMRSHVEIRHLFFVFIVKEDCMRTSSGSSEAM